MEAFPTVRPIHLPIPLFPSLSSQTLPPFTQNLPISTSLTLRSQDTSPSSLTKTFTQIASHPSFTNLPLKVSIFNVKNSSKKPFLSETFEDFMKPMEEYVGGAMVFAQASIKRMMAENGGEGKEWDGRETRGTVVFTGTLVSFSLTFSYLELRVGCLAMR